jgi:TfoX/Sxy family transcriptional regulator of competence genes
MGLAELRFDPFLLWTMTRRHDTPAAFRALLAGLSGVRMRRMFNSEAFFAGPVLFAFFGEDGLVLRLPDDTRQSALDAGLARPFLGKLPEQLGGWVTVDFREDGVALLHAAHTAARGMARSIARKGAGSRRRTVAGR